MRLSALTGPAILLGLTLCLFWKLTLTRQYTWADHPDAANQVLPWLEFQAREWHHGRAPLWDPFNWGGQPLVGRMEPGAACPLNWILFALPLKNGFLSINVLNWYFALLHYVAALGCYWLCRDLKRSRAASLLAAVAFGLGGYVGTIGWPQKVNSALWTPLVLLFFFRSMRGERRLASACLSGGFLGLAWLGGHHQVPTLVAFAMVALWLWRLLENERRLRTLRDAAASAIFAMAVGALQILPALEFGRLAVRWVGAPSAVGWGDRIPYPVHSANALHPASILGIIFPHVDRSANQFIGLAVLSLAAIGVLARWREKEVRLALSLALAGFLFALAPFVVFHGVLYALAPLIEKARSPAAGIHLFHLGAAIIAAYGLDSCRAAGAPVAVVTRVLAAFGASVTLLVLALMTLRPAQGIEYDGMVIAAVIALLVAALLHAWRTGKLTDGVAGACVILLTSIELGNVTGWDYKHRDQSWTFLPRLAESRDLAEYIRSLEGPVRVEIDVNDLPFNFGEWHGIEHFNGHNGLTANVFRLFAHGERLRELFGVNLSIGRKPYRQGQVELYSRPDGIKVFRDRNVMPRVWTVHELVELSPDADLHVALRDTDFRRQAFLFRAPPEVSKCEAGDLVTLVARGSANVTVEAAMKCRGMVVLGDTFYPGWRATVDGEHAEIYEAYGALRGVVVGAGEHRVRFVYRPLSVILGAALTSAGLLSMAFFMFGCSSPPVRRALSCRKCHSNGQTGESLSSSSLLASSFMPPPGATTSSPTTMSFSGESA